MKKIFPPILLASAIMFLFSCSSLRNAFTLTEKDAIAAIRQMLTMGTRDNTSSAAFGKDIILAGLFPESVRKTLNTLNMLGLTSEVDRFTNTLSTAAEKTASASVPIFVNSIDNMRFVDAMGIIKNGGTSATDYLKTSVGDSLRRAIKPVMQSALDEYKLNDQWARIIKPAQSILGSKFNPDLSYLMAAVVSEAMFNKIAEKEKQVRTDATARTTPLLQQVFSRSWQ
jgi:hypothetical protein